MRHSHAAIAFFAAVCSLPAIGFAQNESGASDARARASEIASQPARDIGAQKKDVPPILEEALRNPYGLDGARTCGQMAGELKQLNAALGPDFKVNNIKKENRAGKLAEAGGKSVVNAFIPFRGLVREISGAAPAERHLNAAIDAGYARRGFLRGMSHSKGCKA